MSGKEICACCLAKTYMNLEVSKKNIIEIIRSEILKTDKMLLWS